MPKILIVEVSKDNQDSLAGRLQCKGFDVVFASDAKTGISMALSEKPDLVLMDMNMPDMDGWEATRQLKSLPGGESIPVIAITADSLPGDRDRAILVGCAESHSKPVDFQILMQQIEDLIKNRPIPETEVAAG